MYWSLSSTSSTVRSNWKDVDSFLVDKLTSLGYTSSLIDYCVFFCGDIMFMVYVDGGIFLGNDDAQLQQAVKKNKDLGLNVKD